MRIGSLVTTPHGGTGRIVEFFTHADGTRWAVIQYGDDPQTEAWPTPSLLLFRK